jgi:hypothetical protein
MTTRYSDGDKIAAAILAKIALEQNLIRIAGDDREMQVDSFAKTYRRMLELVQATDREDE